MISKIAGLLILLWAGFLQAGEITLASTTSTQNSGLYDHILPIFEEETGIKVRVVAVGTGQALRIAQNGDADILLVHHRASEDAFVQDGFGIERLDVMFNDFVLIGPEDDPADIASAKTIEEAMEKLAQTQPIFISRGDESGTHKRESELWVQAGLDPQGRWYREIGAGMGAALNMAAATGGYTLSDRGTWLSFGNKDGLGLLFENAAALRNPYGLIVVNPAKHPHVNVFDAQRFAKWITSDSGQKAIASFQVQGVQLFCPAVVTKMQSNGACPSK